jgi:hypothetical protein
MVAACVNSIKNMGENMDLVKLKMVVLTSYCLSMTIFMNIDHNFLK